MGLVHCLGQRVRVAYVLTYVLMHHAVANRPGRYPGFAGLGQLAEAGSTVQVVQNTANGLP